MCLYDKQNNSWLLIDSELFSCSTLEKKFHIYARPCIILYIIYMTNVPSTQIDCQNDLIKKNIFKSSAHVVFKNIIVTHEVAKSKMMHIAITSRSVKNECFIFYVDKNALAKSHL